MSEQPRKENTKPFNPSSLVESNISRHHKGKFFESVDYPNKIIRRENFGDLTDKHLGELEIPKLVDIAKHLYRELREDYGIIAPVDFYLGEDAVYEIVDKIEEKSLDSQDDLKDFIPKAKALYTSIARYFFDKLGNGSMYIWDINGSSQYVYGSKTGEKDAQIYLIDTDIWLGNSRSGLCLSVYWLIRHISDLETKLKTKFDEARVLVERFVDSLPEDLSDEEKKNVKGIKDYLVGLKNNHNPRSAIPKFE